MTERSTATRPALPRPSTASIAVAIIDHEWATILSHGKCILGRYRGRRVWHWDSHIDHVLACRLEMFWNDFHDMQVMAL